MDGVEGRFEEEIARGLSREELLRRAAAAGIVLGSGGLVETALAASTPKRGGTFRLGITGGSAKDLLDGQTIVAKPDQARLIAGFETLLNFDRNYGLTKDGLASSVEATRADVYTIRLRKGIEFHNGKTLTADDLVYSLRRIVSSSLGLFGGSALKASLDPNGLKKLDKYTVRLTLKQKDSTIPEQLAQYYNGIVPVGYDRFPKPQVGTGPYKLKSFTPGRQSVHVRNPNYWRSGEPYFDQVIVIDFPDDTARVNALVSGQIDAMTDVPYAQVSAVKQRSGLHVLESTGGAWIPFCMAIDQDPFKDVRVRQAFRLIVNRPQMVAQAIAGHGRVANDIYSPFDACYDKDLPQRHQDIAKAKSLLKAAGKEGLTIDLQTTAADAGMVEEAFVFARQAKDAGVTVNVKNLDGGTFYGDQYLKWTFSTDFWGTRNYLPQVANGSIPTAPYNESHWPPTSKFISLYKQALATVTMAKRCEIIHEMQKLEYDQGGYVIPFFKNLVDAYSNKVQGLKPSKATLNLDTFGHGYRTIWFS